MANLVALSELRTRAKYRANMENSSFVTDSEWATYINTNLRAIYDVLVMSAGPDYYRSTTTIAAVAGTVNYSLPADFYKLIAAYAQSAGRIVTLTKTASAVNYAAPTTGVTVQIDYVPVCTKLVLDTDTFDFRGIGWEELVIQMAARDALDKEESDVSTILQRIGELKADIQSASTLDVGTPEMVVDVYDLLPDPWYYGVTTGVTAYRQSGTTISLYSGSWSAP